MCKTTSQFKSKNQRTLILYLISIIYKQFLKVNASPVITQLELLGFPGITDKEMRQIEKMLENCIIIDINNAIKSEVVRLKKTHSLKLPDCIVAATAIYLDLPLITSDKGFKKIEELNLMFYEK